MVAHLDSFLGRKNKASTCKSLHFHMDGLVWCCRWLSLSRRPLKRACVPSMARRCLSMCLKPQITERSRQRKWAAPSQLEEGLSVTARMLLAHTHQSLGKAVSLLSLMAAKPRGGNRSSIAHMETSREYNGLLCRTRGAESMCHVF